MKCWHNVKAMSSRAARPRNAWSESLADHRHRQTILIGRTALELVSRHGISAVSMRQLAAAAGVSRATLYHYFSDVESALLAYLGEAGEDYRRELEQALSSIEDPVDRLDRYVEHQVTYLAGDQHRTGTALLQAAAQSPRLAHVLREHVSGPAGVVARILEDGKAAGAFDRTLDPALYTTLVLHVLAGASAALEAGTSAGDVVSAVRGLLHRGLPAPGRKQSVHAGDEERTKGLRRG